jgi:5-deoxy-glucuronate isomerase
MKNELLVAPERFTGRVEHFGYEYLSFTNVKLGADGRHEAETAERELAVVVLGGRCSVESSRGEWRNFGARAHVFDGLPYTLYLPPHTHFQVSTEKGCDLALCYSKAEEEHAARLVTPDQVRVEIRGGGNATRQIHHILTPEFPAHRLLVVEVFTPAGNWSSYPPHKHDVHNPPGEVDLEEIYYYRLDRPEGYAIQKVYTADRRIGETLSVRDGEFVLIPEGYHPVVAAHGYNVYYLNALAGSARSMAVPPTTRTTPGFAIHGASRTPDYRW